jgi:hypothetical protein
MSTKWQARGCKYFTHDSDKGRCSLKSAVGSRYPSPGKTSGKIPGLLVSGLTVVKRARLVKKATQIGDLIDGIQDEKTSADGLPKATVKAKTPSQKMLTSLLDYLARDMSYSKALLKEYQTIAPNATDSLFRKMYTHCSAQEREVL